MFTEIVKITGKHRNKVYKEKGFEDEQTNEI